MPQEESKRGAHFAKGPTPSASSPELASVEHEIRKAWSAAADPGETAVYLRAACSCRRGSDVQHFGYASCPASR